MPSQAASFRFARTLSNSVLLLRETLFNMAGLKMAAFFALGCGLHYGLGLSCLVTTACVFGVYLATGGYKFTWIVIKTLPRDVRALTVLIRLNLMIRYYLWKGKTVPQIFLDTVKRHPNKLCFMSEGSNLTFQDVENHSNAVANFFLEQGIRRGDVVGLYMENRPEYVCYWLGLSKIGALAALINFNLREGPLIHSINCAHVRHLVFGGELSQAVRDVRESLPEDLVLYCHGPMATDSLSPMMIEPHLKKSSTTPPPPIKQGFKDKLFYVFTSGTTGFPKAAVITHTRFYYMSQGVTQLLGVSSSDIVYNVLPLYHTAGGIIGVGQALIQGATVALRRKFSASQFWDECVKYQATVAQYIGEICRYLLAQPNRPSDTKHKVRLMFGNGLRPQIWTDFQNRFGVRTMGEFYGATEGNCSIINIENKVGAVGFTTRIVPSLYPITLVRVDEVTGELMRGKDGLCIPAEPGQPGELVGKIVKGNPLREFDGYVNKSETDKKVAMDVFRRGDFVFLTGDVLVMDDFGYMYFRDRTGDTFRWRGENVSTSEVEAVIMNIVKLRDVVVYGVEVPGVEGRAGMAAIVDESRTLDLQELNESLHRALPPYARPVFLRIGSSVDTTGTFKLKKTDMRRDGFNPRVVKDPVYFMNGKTGRYERVNDEVFQGIVAGKIRI